MPRVQDVISSISNHQGESDGIQKKKTIENSSTSSGSVHPLSVEKLYLSMDKLKDRLELVEIENELMKSKVQQLEEELAAMNDDLLRSRTEIESLTEQMAQFNIAPPELDLDAVDEFFGEMNVRDAPFQQENEFFNFEYEMAAPQQHQEVVDVYNAEDDEEPARFFDRR